MALLSFNFPEDRYNEILKACRETLEKNGIPHITNEEDWPHVSILSFEGEIPKDKWEEFRKVAKEKPLFSIKDVTVFPGKEHDFLVLELDVPQEFMRTYDWIKSNFKAFAYSEIRPHASILKVEKKYNSQLKEILPEIKNNLSGLLNPVKVDLIMNWSDYKVKDVSEKKSQTGTVTESIDEGYKEAKYSGTFYHGSPVEVKSFGLTGDGRLGKGLYLTTEKWADFHAKGGRIGHARNLKDKGFVYEFEVSGDAAIIVNEERFLRSLVGEFEPAEEAYSRTGDLYSKAVSKYISDWAQEYGFDMVVFPGDEGMIVEFPHILVVKEGVAKLKKQVSESFIQDFIDSYYDDEWGQEQEDFGITEQNKLLKDIKFSCKTTDKKFEEELCTAISMNSLVSQSLFPEEKFSNQSFETKNESSNSLVKATLTESLQGYEIRNPSQAENKSKFISDFIEQNYDPEWVPEVLEEAKKKKKKKKKSAQYAFAPFYGRGDGTSGATMPPFRSPTGGPTPKLGPSLPGPTGINAPQFGTLAASAAKFGNLSEEDSELKSIEYLKSLAPELAQAAQKIYNDWDEDDTDTYANGGICHFIADAMVEIMFKHGVDCATVSSSHEQHVYCVAKVEEGVYSVDIHWSYYEAGGGFSWKKIKDVEFDGGMVEFYKITPDPEEFESYIEAW